MSETVIPFRVIEAGSTPPNPGAIAILKDMLARAESGEIQSVAIAYLTARASGAIFDTTSAGECERMSGLIQVLSARVTNSLLNIMDEREDPRDVPA